MLPLFKINEVLTLEKGHSRKRHTGISDLQPDIMYKYRHLFWNNIIFENQAFPRIKPPPVSDQTKSE